MDEADLIARYFAPLAGPGGLGLRDDAALVAPPAGAEIVLTADALVAGVHFFAGDPPEAIAAKALAVNLSDLAAKAADPLGFLLTIALPGDWTPQWLEVFAKGLGDLARESRCPLLGGDTVATPGPLTLSITALGSVPAGRMIRRAGAKPGDRLYVSGTIGDAALGLALRRAELEGAPAPPWVDALDAAQKAHLVRRYLVPEPRLALTPALRACASAAMDVSDGLAGDLSALLRASGVGARVDLREAPLSPAAAAALRADPGLFEILFSSGDDYEILCAAAPEQAVRFEALAGGAVTAIGEVGPASAGAVFLGPDGDKLNFARDRYSHF
ncbi:thiamine-phosphate kinase [Rhodoblastus acidophilus]|uniref:Thiamine-monophosphate kinase n=1 Tax=Candidatus Rhodoblastus alkanivorans TaxID=2954117 RepID=A0ABS9Z7X3_9HYPH|nr:thiamine-phosphate kinase [Candidatus Rhodoblastus alkanivorans]MCI4679150.1 thiamine-phosphate kinase [Candidatus Rhodoblastus alkanivorans]MCI4683146.1 thiamine-phosphate kinase [Candidatus Rhodoblastus alkanivorans]MDI4640457.1 thiamine-phosphate kinase [Rhodoblastus acidophilus]